MKSSLFAALLLIALFGLSLPGYSTHLAGADISVAYIGADTANLGTHRLYRLTLNLFRDCNGAGQLFNTATVCRTNACGINEQYVLPRLPGFPIDVSQICDDPAFTTSCTGGPTQGYELHRYQDVISIPNPVVNQTDTCRTYTFDWSQGNRNFGINNIQGSGTKRLRVWLEYFFENDFTNNTPVFSATFPVPYKCFTPVNGFPFSLEQTVSFSALELEGDSLSYMSSWPDGGNLCGTDVPLAFVNTGNGGAVDHSFANPFASTTGTTVNQLSGVVSFNPVATGYYVMAVEVIESDPITGRTLSRAVRDIQIVVEPCSNAAPIDSTGIVNLQGQADKLDDLSIALCVGEEFAYDIIVHDIDTSGNLSMDSMSVFADSLQALMPGAVLTHSGTNPDTISISWVVQPGTAPLFSFVLSISDNACPVPGVTDLNFNVRVKPSAQIVPDNSVICLGDTLTMVSRFGKVREWISLPGSTPLVEGVNYFPSDSLDTARVIPSVNSTYVLVSSLATCDSVDTFNIEIDTRDATVFSDDIYCFNQSPAPVLTAATPGGVWSGPGIHPTTGELNLKEVDPGPRVAREELTIVYSYLSPAGCLSTDTVNPEVVNFNAILDSLPPLCTNSDEVVNLKDWTYFKFGEFISIPNGDAKALGSNLTEDGLLDQSGLDAGSYAITHILDTICSVRFDTVIPLNKPPNAKIIDYEDIYCTHDDDTVYFGAASDSGYWGGNAIIDPTTGAMVPNTVGAGTYNLSYVAIDPVTRCKAEDLVTFKISHSPPRPRVLYEGPYCEGDRLSDLTADGLRTNSYRWYSDSSGSDNSLLHRGRTLNVGELSESIDLHVTQTNEDGCESFTAQQWIEVVKLPVVDFDADPWEGIRLPLEVDFTNQTDAAIRYAWDFGDGFASNEENPDAHIFQELGIYNVTLWADNGVCQNSITKAIIADAEVLVNIPNVFTPNSDGFNDKWAPEWDNIDQANVQVFNRWGQQVYEFEDPSDGWDGGNQKDGVYFYVLRGIEHSLSAKPIQYSGDITLIRGE